METKIIATATTGTATATTAKILEVVVGNEKLLILLLRMNLWQ